MTKKIVTLAGDGIGPEIMAAGLEVLAAVAPKIGFDKCAFIPASSDA